MPPFRMACEQVPQRCERQHGRANNFFGCGGRHVVEFLEQLPPPSRGQRVERRRGIFSESLAHFLGQDGTAEGGAFHDIPHAQRSFRRGGWAWLVESILPGPCGGQNGEIARQRVEPRCAGIGHVRVRTNLQPLVERLESGEYLCIVGRCEICGAQLQERRRIVKGLVVDAGSQFELRP